MFFLRHLSFFVTTGGAVIVSFSRRRQSVGAGDGGFISSSGRLGGDAGSIDNFVGDAIVFIGVGHLHILCFRRRRRDLLFSGAVVNSFFMIFN